MGRRLRLARRPNRLEDHSMGPPIKRAITVAHSISFLLSCANEKDLEERTSVL